MKSRSRFVWLAVTALTLVTTACSAPPGPGPGKPAPKIPADAVAYDDLKSADRAFPFTDDCTQITPKSIDDAGLSGPARPVDVMGDKYCVISNSDEHLNSVQIQALKPNPKEPTRVFPEIWSGNSNESGANGRNHFRRFLLLDKYYATETIGVFLSGPSCFINVDMGSQPALQFRGFVDEQFGNNQYKALIDNSTRYIWDQSAVKQFVNDNCPPLIKAAEAFIGAIDPDGGSLASS